MLSGGWAAVPGIWVRAGCWAWRRRMWVLRCHLWAARCGHSGQGYRRSPVCVTRWCSRFCRRLRPWNRLPHTAHSSPTMGVAPATSKDLCSPPWPCWPWGMTLTPVANSPDACKKAKIFTQLCPTGLRYNYLTFYSVPESAFSMININTS